MIDLKQLNEFAGIEAENFDQFKEQFQTKFVLKENVVKDPDLTSAITGKVMGSQMTKIRQMFKEEGIEITEEETKTIKKNEELFQLGMNKLKGSYINQLEDVKKSSALGTESIFNAFGSLSINSTWWPFSNNSRAIALPTLPAPAIAILILHLQEI